MRKPFPVHIGIIFCSRYYSGIRLINPRLINPAAYYIQFAWNGIVPFLSRYFRKRRLLKPLRIKSKTGCPEVDLLTEFHCIELQKLLVQCIFVPALQPSKLPLSVFIFFKSMTWQS